MRVWPIIALVLILGTSVASQVQDKNSRQPGQSFGNGPGFGGVMGRGVLGTVTEVAPGHYTVKTAIGELYTIHYSVNTRILKGGAMRRGERDEDGGPPANPPQPIKATDIKVGDAIAANGEVDAAAKSVGAVVVFQIDPERARQMREMQANYGKTWFLGQVTAINEVKVTVQGGPDNATRTFTADENTTFRKRRDPITLADIKVGDMVRVEGAMKGGEFLASNVAVMGPPPNGPSNREPGNGGPLDPPQ
jgi:hypothetical protein